MNYVQFAYLYDELMADAPYDQWVSFVLNQINTLPLNSKILDVGCGTGNIAIPLSKKGYELMAVDLSEEMLMVAKGKSDLAKTEIKFFQQDMRELNQLGSFDVVVSLCDSINYLETEDDIIKTFQGINEHLDKSGLFIFDVHSIYKIEELFIGKTFAYSGEDISYIWDCFAGDEPYSVEHELSFFIKKENGLYERFDEIHRQRTFSVNFFMTKLEQCGFELLSVTSDFSLDKFDTNGERWFFVARKK